MCRDVMTRDWRSLKTDSSCMAGVDRARRRGHPKRCTTVQHPLRCGAMVRRPLAPIRHIGPLGREPLWNRPPWVMAVYPRRRGTHAGGAALTSRRPSSRSPPRASRRTRPGPRCPPRPPPPPTTPPPTHPPPPPRRPPRRKPRCRRGP